MDCLIGAEMFILPYYLPIASLIFLFKVYQPSEIFLFKVYQPSEMFHAKAILVEEQ